MYMNLLRTCSVNWLSFVYNPCGNKTQLEVPGSCFSVRFVVCIFKFFLFLIFFKNRINQVGLSVGDFKRFSFRCFHLSFSFCLVCFIFIDPSFRYNFALSIIFVNFTLFS